MTENTISIVAVSESDLRDDTARIPALTEVKIQDLASNLKGFLNQLDEILTDLNKKAGSFELDTLEVHAEISTEGRVSLLGTGIQGGTKGGLKLILRRSRNVS